MKIIEYHCTLYGEPTTYQLVQLKDGESYKLFFGKTLIGTFDIVNGHCKQTGGRMVTDAMVMEIGELIR